jgi:hypothetical protein
MHGAIPPPPSKSLWCGGELSAGTLPLPHSYNLGVILALPCLQSIAYVKIY